MRRSLTVLLLALAAATAPPPPAAHAQDALTPEGPMTLRERWLGASTLEGRSPEVITRVRITVGRGGRAGRIRLRILDRADRATVKGTGGWESLPAEPGTYELPAPHVRYDPRDSGIALDQETGGHAIVTRHEDDPAKERWSDPYELQAIDVFRPPLADDARDVERSERLQGHELMVAPVIEPDSDEDLVGDRTEEVGDLTALRARFTDKRDGLWILTARVRNNGTTVRHLPQIKRPDAAYGWQCADPQQSARFWLACPGRAISPGEETDVRVAVNIGGRGVRGPYPSHVEVVSEGRDTNPGDNVVAITPNLTLTALAPRPALVRRGTAGVTATVSADQAATVVVATRLAGVRVARSVTLPGPGTQTVWLAPTSRADRRRVNRALRRRGRLTAIVSAAAGPGVYAADQRVTLARR